jgi:DNA polymerase III delta prime subunit
VPLSLTINSFNDLLISDKIKSALDIYLNASQSMTPLLLYGPYGSGKTTIATHLPLWRTPACKNIDMNVLEGSAAQVNRALVESHLRRIEKIAEGPYQISLVEEVESIKNHNQFCVSVDKMKSYVWFIFTTNKFNEVDPKLRSRCNKLFIDIPSAQIFESAFINILARKGYEPPTINEVRSEFLDWQNSQNLANGFEDIRNFNLFLEYFSHKHNIQ